MAIRTRSPAAAKQRAGVARGMAMEPDILLMDEPFAALDALTQRTCQGQIAAALGGDRIHRAVRDPFDCGGDQDRPHSLAVAASGPGPRPRITDVDQVSSEDGSAAQRLG